MGRRKSVWDGGCSEGRGRETREDGSERQEREIDPLASCLASSAAVNILML